MSTNPDCPPHPDGHLCIAVGKHSDHGALVDGEWVWWQTPPTEAEKRVVRGRKPSKDDLMDRVFVVQNTSVGRMVGESDRETSKRAAASAAPRTGTQKHRLLAVYAQHPDGLTDDEAAQHAGLLGQIGSCWWHRSTDLREEGRIEEIGVRPSRVTGEDRMVCVITDFGRMSL